MCTIFAPPSTLAGPRTVAIFGDSQDVVAIFDGAERGSGEWSSGLDTIKNLH